MGLPNLPFKTGHLFIGLAILMGGLTLVLSQGPEKKALPISLDKPADVSTSSVVVPLNAISRGKVIQLADITVVKWPTGYLPKTGQWYQDADHVAGRVARQDLYPGEPLFIDKLSGNGNGSGLPSLIPPGMRAVTVAVTEIKGVAGFVKPGDRVDVLGTFEVDAPTGQGPRQRISRTVLQNVLVLAAAQSMQEPERAKSPETPDSVKKGDLGNGPKSGSFSDGKSSGADAEKKSDDKKADNNKKGDEKAETPETEKGAKLVSSVTLALTPPQAQAIALVEEAGEVRLSLRAEQDRSVQPIRSLNLDQITGVHHQASPPALSVKGAVDLPKPVYTGPTVELIQGTEKSIRSF